MGRHPGTDRMAFRWPVVARMSLHQELARANTLVALTTRCRSAAGRADEALLAESAEARLLGWLAGRRTCGEGAQWQTRRLAGWRESWTP